MKIDDAVIALSALAHKARLEIIRMLVQRGGAGASAGDIADHLGAAPSAVSFHLSGLTDAGLIKAHRQSRHQIYKVQYDALGALMGYIVKDCCASDVRVTKCC